jgi:hypothetical protein
MNRGEDIEHYADKMEDREIARAMANTAIFVDEDRQQGNWIRGTVIAGGDEFSFTAKVFPEPSDLYGITDFGGEGHVSKLHVDDGETALNYDRGWDFNRLDDPTVYAIVDAIERYVTNEFSL